MKLSNIRRFRRRLHQRCRGAALIEMAVVLVVLFYLVMGGVEFGWFMYSKHTVQAAARDAARAAIISNATHAQANAAATDTMTSAGFGSTGYTTTYQRVYAGSGGTLTSSTITDVSTVGRGEGIRVTVTAPFSAFRVRPLGVIPANKAVTGVTLMVKE